MFGGGGVFSSSPQSSERFRALTRAGSEDGSANFRLGDFETGFGFVFDGEGLTGTGAGFVFDGEGLTGTGAGFVFDGEGFTGAGFGGSAVVGGGPYSLTKPKFKIYDLGQLTESF